MKTVFILVLCLTLTYCAVIKREAPENEEEGRVYRIENFCISTKSRPEREEGGESKTGEEKENKEDEAGENEQEEKGEEGGDKKTEEDGEGEEKEMKESAKGEDSEVGKDKEHEREGEEKHEQGEDCKKEKKDTDGEGVVYFVPIPIEIVDTVYDVYAV
ncbi:unnamed protein product [Pieris macdunnoughi]|uniref:Uncharacterized protein n=1 Tax=Pieris macdunnoughi TaxID=345717 RepID=A0A821SZE7_9NEOP|nr:unnamed protein product [Pieris macdunnoughi]